MEPFIRNSWYCVGWSHEIDVQPKGIRVLGDYLVIYRGAEGQVIAMDGRCPHRFAPLDRGSVIGDRIICPYHGLQFDSSGACALNPHGDGHIPPLARLNVYAATERNRAIWVWMGDKECADPEQLPRETKLSSPDYSNELAYLNVKAHYQLVIDNLLDLTHAPFLHMRTLAGESPIGELRHSYRKDGDVVYSTYAMDAMPPSPQMVSLFKDALGSFSADMTWYPAATLELDIWQRPLPHGEAEALNLPSVHYITPETETSTHYFAAIGRNLKIDAADEDERMREFIMRAFINEDEPMIRACQELMQTTDLFSLNPAILKTDIAAVQARRIISQRAALEAKAKQVE